MASQLWHRTRAEEALAESEELMASALEGRRANTPEGDDAFDNASLGAVVSLGIALGHALIAQVQIPEEKQ